VLPQCQPPGGGAVVALRSRRDAREGLPLIVAASTVAVRRELRYKTHFPSLDTCAATHVAPRPHLRSRITPQQQTTSVSRYGRREARKRTLPPGTSTRTRAQGGHACACGWWCNKEYKVLPHYTLQVGFPSRRDYRGLLSWQARALRHACARGVPWVAQVLPVTKPPGGGCRGFRLVSGPNSDAHHAGHTS
jgi:hypothetical protein